MADDYACETEVVPGAVLHAQGSIKKEEERSSQVKKEKPRKSEEKPRRVSSLKVLLGRGLGIG